MGKSKEDKSYEYKYVCPYPNNEENINEYLHPHFEDGFGGNAYCLQLPCPIGIEITNIHNTQIGSSSIQNIQLKSTTTITRSPLLYSVSVQDSLILESITETKATPSHSLFGILFDSREASRLDIKVAKR